MAVAVTRTEHSAEALRGAARRTRDTAQARRLLALALVLDGASRTAAARACGMDRQTLRDWVQAHAKPLEIWFQDEARIGQKGTLTRIWARIGSRPPGPRDTRYEWAYIFAAVCPERATGAALVMPYANTEAMNLHLQEISRSVAPGAHAALVFDGAGWHTSPALELPENITPVCLPSYAPELNPTENIWEYLRKNYLALRVLDDYDAIVDACCKAWNDLIAKPHRLASITQRNWAKVS